MDENKQWQKIKDAWNQTFGEDLSDWLKSEALQLAKANDIDINRAPKEVLLNLANQAKINLM